jgi:hypothetical protein
MATCGLFPNNVSKSLKSADAPGLRMVFRRTKFFAHLQHCPFIYGGRELLGDYFVLLVFFRTFSPGPEVDNGFI